MPYTPKKNTNITKSQGVVIGEHNSIYLYFTKPENSNIAHYHLDYQTLIEEKTRSFVGRRFLETALDNYLINHDSGYFILEGVPGIGKTAFLSNLAKTRGYPHHFNIAQQNIRSTKQFLGNACAQIIARYKLGYKEIAPEKLEDSNFFLECLAEAVKKSKGQPVVFLIDAIDESDFKDLPLRANPHYLPPDLPKGAYILLTTRPAHKLNINVSNQEVVPLVPDSESNSKDISTYIKNYIGESRYLRAYLKKNSLTLSDFQKKLLLKSEGNFIYLRYVLPAIAEGKYDLESFQNLPQGLVSYYKTHWSQMQFASNQKFNDVFMPIVCFLAVVREPVTIELLCDWTGIGKSHVVEAINQWREFLLVESNKKEYKYIIYHSSFQDFLLDVVDLKMYDRLISEYYLSKLGYVKGE